MDLRSLQHNNYRQLTGPVDSMGVCMTMRIFGELMFQPITNKDGDRLSKRDIAITHNGAVVQ
jgi:hypothetical protein